jgi:hypothetical protein
LFLSASFAAAESTFAHAETRAEKEPVAIIVADAVQSARRVSVMEENRAVELAAKMMSKEKIENIKFILSEDYVFSTLLKAIEPDGFVETSSSDSDSISVKIEE